MARNITYREALNEALTQEMERDETVIVMGEDNAGGAGAPGEDDAWGGVLGVTKGLYHKFHGRDAPGGRADVRRLHGRLLRPDLQPGREVPVHVRRQGGHPSRDPHHVRGGAAGRGPALPVPVPAVHPHPRAEGGPPGHPVRREGPADPGHQGQRPGDVLRAQGALRHVRPGARGELRAAVRGGQRGPRGRRRHDRDPGPDGAHLAGSGRAARRGRGAVRGRRPAHHQPAGRGHRAGERRGHRPAGRGRRGASPVQHRHRHLRAGRPEGVRLAAGPDRNGDRAAHPGAVLQRARGHVHPGRAARGERGQDGHRVVPVTDDRIVPVTMPKWGLSMQLGKITSWVVAEGDEVQVGDDLADIETEKITGTLEAADAGTVRRIVARVGEDVPVSGTIALIAPAEVSDDALDAAVLQARAVIDAGVPDDAGGGAELQTADVGGRKISFAGAGEDGDVVLLVHGYGGDRNSWLFLQEPLAAKYRVYALDLPGHGTSAKDVGDGTLGVLADAVTGVLDALGAARAHLVGHSLGGAVALAVAARDPGRIASLTLIAPAGFGAEINTGYLRGFADAQSRRELKPVVAQLFADERLVTRQLVDDLLAYKRLDGVAEALHTLLGVLLDGDAQGIHSAALLAEAGRAMPVTVVWGRADRVIPAAQAESVAGAVRYVIDGAGHMPHMERPAEVQAAVEETIARST